MEVGEETKQNKIKGEEKNPVLIQLPPQQIP